MIEGFACGTSGAHVEDFLGGEFGGSVVFTFGCAFSVESEAVLVATSHEVFIILGPLSKMRDGPSAFRIHVLMVLQACSLAKVDGVGAFWIITRMENKQRLVEASIMDQE